MDDHQKRTYGYIGQKKTPENHESPKTPPLPKPDSSAVSDREYSSTHSSLPPMKSKRKQSSSQFSDIAGRILVGLGRFLVVMMKGLWTGVVWIFRHHPRLKKGAGKSLVAFLFRLGLSVAILGFLIFVVVAAWVSKDLPDPNRLTDREIAQSTKIYDRTGEHLLYEIFADEKRTLINLDQISPNVVNGLIATEDTQFYSHHGIRPLSIARSFVYGMLGKQRIGSGASTITQQLVKNAILTDERTLTRKLKEFILAIRLEQKYTKDQILKIYFNEIPYGSTNYGIESASQAYFGKSAKDLDLQEAATLAGIPKAPTKYLNDPDALKNRRNFVLGRMYAEGYITEQEKNDAQAMPLTLKSRVTNSIVAPHFVLYVKQLLVDQFGEQMVETGGLKVITTLDWEKQQIADDIASSTKQEIVRRGANNMALVAMNPKTGEILSLIGSQDYFNDDINGQFNVAVDGRRQPGSSIKPMVYTAAFEKGYTPETVLYDVVTNFAASGKPYMPRDYDLKERGPVTIRQALQGSLNIPAVETMYLAGDDKVTDFVKRVGYTTLDVKDLGLSLVLGGGGVSMVEHAGAYGVFANEGTYHKPTAIVRVEDPTGDVLYEEKPTNGEQVIDKKYAALISNVLSDDAARAYMFGTGSKLTLPGRPVAAKTGTTNAYKDAWTVGYTPSLVTVVWVGNTDNTPMKEGAGGFVVGSLIWNDFMSKSLKNTPVEQFPEPPKNEAKKPVLRGAAGGQITLQINRITGKIASSSTPPQYIEEHTYIQPHSILHYVNKDDPVGPPPENPAADPQYNAWEAAIQNWIKLMKEKSPDWRFSFDEPPTDYDDAYDPALVPTLVVHAPQPNSTITNRHMNFDISVSAPRGVARVTYMMDGKTIGTATEHPFTMSYFGRDFVNGQHALTIVVEDDVGNRFAEDIPFIFDGSSEPPTVFWRNDKMTMTKEDFPKVFLLIPFQPEKIKDVTFVARSIKDNSLISLGTVPVQSDGTLSFTWSEAPEKGEWSLSATTVGKEGGIQISTMLVEIR